MHIYANLDKYKIEIQNVLDKIIKQEFGEKLEAAEPTQISNPEHGHIKEHIADMPDEYYPVSNDAMYYQLRDGIAKISLKKMKQRQNRYCH